MGGRGGRGDQVVCTDRGRLFAWWPMHALPRMMCVPVGSAAVARMVAWRNGVGVIPLESCTQ
eukprot:12573770-Prorocentrum_lima.AAC.1